MTTICQLNSVPPNPPRTWFRFTQQFNPHSLYTEHELAERRKYEVLQHGSKQHNKTQKQHLVEILRGSSKCNKPSWTIQKEGVQTNPNVLGLPRIGNTLIYNNNNYKQTECTSSNRSNVPGKEILLCKRKVPVTMLYTRRTYL